MIDFYRTQCYDVEGYPSFRLWRSYVVPNG